MREESSGIIELRVSNHKAYVWDVTDLALLRAQHHICGVLTGTLPHVSQQNVFLGMPLVLMPEEVVLLVEKQLAVLVDDPSAHLTPPRAALEKWNVERNASIMAQLAADDKVPTEDIAARSMSDDAIRKRKEREERRAAAALAKASAEDQDNLCDDSPVPPAPTDISSNIAPPPPHPGLSQALYTVTVPAPSHSDLPWYSSEGCTYTNIDAAVQAGIWSYPSNLHERAKCGVFRDLWEKGHFMGGGIRFGGDYLVYPGDPLRYHSHFSATVVDSPIATITPMEIVAHGRLGTATKKAHLLCGWDDDKQAGIALFHRVAGFG